MKHMKYLGWGNAIALIALLIGLLAFPQVPVQAQIAGSGHDFSGAGWSGGEICVACHTPHNADTTVAGAPLWNHDVTGSTFALYGGTGTLDATDLGQPAGVSRLCLSCHDGTVALDSFGGTTGTTTIAMVGTGSGDFGTDLSNDHPISFTYNAALAGTDGELQDPSTFTTALGGTISNDLLFGGGSDQLECASCHDVHNSTGLASLLLIDNAGSALCLTCHAK